MTPLQYLTLIERCAGTVVWRAVYSSTSEAVNNYVNQQNEAQAERERSIEAMMRGGKPGSALSGDEALLARKLKELEDG